MLHKYRLVVEKRKKQQPRFLPPPPAGICSALRAKKNANRRKNLFSTFSPKFL
jgi:hypothetical protein